MEAAAGPSDTSENFSARLHGMCVQYEIRFVCTKHHRKWGGHMSHNTDSEATLHAVACHSHNHTRG